MPTPPTIGRVPKTEHPVCRFETPLFPSSSGAYPSKLDSPTVRMAITVTTNKHRVLDGLDIDSSMAAIRFERLHAWYVPVSIILIFCLFWF
jgi:hypothetical protein